MASPSAFQWDPLKNNVSPWVIKVPGWWLSERRVSVAYSLFWSLGHRELCSSSWRRSGCLPLWVTLEEWALLCWPDITIFPDTSTGVLFLRCLSQALFFLLCCWPLMDIGACLLFTMRCIVTLSDLLLFEPDAVCRAAFNPLKGWRMQFTWMMALYKKAKSYCTSCLSGVGFPVSTPHLFKLMNREAHFGGFDGCPWEMATHSGDH